MSDLGTRIRALVEWTAPPIDPQQITRGRASRPARWVPILGAFVVVLIVGAFAFVFAGWQPGDPAADGTSLPVDVTDPPVDSSVVVESTTETTFGEPVPYSLTVVRVDCTTELAAFPCSALVDRDPTTEWQAQSIVGASFTFRFAESVSLDRVGFVNIPDRTRFLRNGRIRIVEIATSDGRSDVAELVDSNDGTQWVEFDEGGTPVEWVELTVTAAYPGVRVGDLEPFMETALAGVEFEGYSYGTDLLGSVYDALDSVRPDPGLVSSLGLEQCGEGPIDAWVIGVARVYCRPGNDHFGGFMMRTYVTGAYPGPLPGGTTADVSDPPSDLPARVLGDGSIAYIDDVGTDWGEIEGLSTVPLTDPTISWHVIVVKPEGLVVHLNAQRTASSPPPTGITDLDTLLAIADSITIGVSQAGP